MNCLKVMLFVVVLAIVPISLSYAHVKHDEYKNVNQRSEKYNRGRTSPFFNNKKHMHPPPSAPWVNPRVKLTCDKFPRVCHVSGSPGPDCCKKTCVNVKRDRVNCGMCGLKCRYQEVCCGGRCVNPFYDRNNCGGCHNKCKVGNNCNNGMCNYA